MTASRWIRCLFLREFHFEDTQAVWDAIFANFYSQEDKGDHHFVEYVVLAMIVHVKQYRNPRP